MRHGLSESIDWRKEEGFNTVSNDLKSIEY